VAVGATEFDEPPTGEPEGAEQPGGFGGEGLDRSEMFDSVSKWADRDVAFCATWAPGLLAPQRRRREIPTVGSGRRVGLPANRQQPRGPSQESIGRGDGRLTTAGRFLQVLGQNAGLHTRKLPTETACDRWRAKEGRGSGGRERCGSAVPSCQPDVS